MGGCDTAGERGSELITNDYRDTIDTEQTAVVAVVEAIAAVTGESSSDLDLLAETIDPDALDQIFKDDEGDVRVEFTYSGYRVVVTGSHVEIHRIEDSR